MELNDNLKEKKEEKLFLGNKIKELKKNNYEKNNNIINKKKLNEQKIREYKRLILNLKNKDINKKIELEKVL